jgi:hypothetical protein
MDVVPAPAPVVARTVVVGDGIAWMTRARLDASHAIVTSLPDVSELRPMTLPAWKDWFVETAELVCRTVAASAPAVFYQSDVRHEGTWVDKAHLVALGADRAGARCLFHKIVCRAPAGVVVRGRPAYAHLLAFSSAKGRVPVWSSADVLPTQGAMSWSRAMGTAACEEAVGFVASAGCTTVVDPFCGYGTALAVANAFGLDALGVELSPSRAAKARGLRFVRGRGLV